MGATLTVPDAMALETKAARDDTANRRRRKGFFTDTTLCIGCKACEVACKQWNQLPDDGLRVYRHVVR
jgi:Fe-S-cluster-containing dehydrogenase component